MSNCLNLPGTPMLPSGWGCFGLQAHGRPCLVCYITLHGHRPSANQCHCCNTFYPTTAAAMACNCCPTCVCPF